jgi:cell division protein ZapA (FtsZ GTPase activity inhibitor)
MSKGTTVKLNIHGTQLSLKTDDPDYIHELAAFIEQEISKVESSGKVASPLKTITIAMLNIADELFRLRKEKEELSEKLSERIGSMLEMAEETYRSARLPKDQE